MGCCHFRLIENIFEGFNIRFEVIGYKFCKFVAVIISVILPTFRFPFVGEWRCFDPDPTAGFLIIFL